MYVGLQVVEGQGGQALAGQDRDHVAVEFAAAVPPAFVADQEGIGRGQAQHGARDAGRAQKRGRAPVGGDMQPGNRDAVVRVEGLALDHRYGRVRDGAYDGEHRRRISSKASPRA
jgi:hypothetical protein